VAAYTEYRVTLEAVKRLGLRLGLGEHEREEMMQELREEMYPGIMEEIDPMLRTARKTGQPLEKVKKSGRKGERKRSLTESFSSATSEEGDEECSASATSSFGSESRRPSFEGSLDDEGTPRKRAKGGRSAS
jgi:hypothetical protein